MEIPSHMSLHCSVFHASNAIFCAEAVLGPEPWSGDSGAKVLVRANGSALGGAGIGNALADPMLELYDVNGTLLASNDNWRPGSGDRSDDHLA